MADSKTQDDKEDREAIGLSVLGPWCGLSAPSKTLRTGRTRALSCTMTMMGTGMDGYWSGTLEDDDTARLSNEAINDNAND